jgi:hypothetical protein
MKKGQYIRLLLATTANPTTVIAAAKTMTLHGSATTEDSSTKDTTGDDIEYEVTGLSYDISGSGLVLTTTDPLNTGAVSANDALGMLGDTLLYWRICLMEGTNNRTIVADIASGQAKLTQWSAQAQNKQNVTYNYTLTGYGALAPGTDSVSSGTD